MVEKVLLVHGFNKNKNDMKTLMKHLESLGYEGVLVNLSLTFKEINYSINKLEKELEKIISRMDEDEKICLIGHSTGGLIIRKLLYETKYKDKIDSCILISTPNRGSELADIVTKHFKLWANIFRTLKSLESNEVGNIGFKKINNIKIGALAGNKSNLLLGKLLKDENDGRVKVNSVRYDDLDDFIVLPYGHKEIHYKIETANQIDNFIKTGKFKLSN